jgi:Arc/MetJ family transcription regulator
MRSTVTLDKKCLDELVYATGAKSKAAAVNEAVSEYLRRSRIERIIAMKGKLEFDLDLDEWRHRER